jgi:hypothetical protein
MTIQEINAGLKIVKLKDQKFKTEGGYYKPDGYALKHSTLGYFSFDTEYPYIPSGGRKALKAILEAGGLLNFDNVNWLQPLN